MKIKILISQFKSFYSKTVHVATTQYRNSGVKLPNCYSHAKFEKFLPAIYRDIHHLINVNYYS